MRLKALVPAVWVLGLVAGCGGSDTGNALNDAPSISVEELPAKYAAALCQAYTNCAGDLYAIFRPGEDCVTNTTVTLQEALAPLPDSIKAGTVKYDGTKVQACLDEISSGDCSTLSNRTPDSCKAALQGTVATGGDCTLDGECDGDAYCKLGDACPGKCAPYEHAGGACAGDSDCVSGLKCGVTGLCVAPAKDGEMCKQGEPDCADGFVCLGDNATMKTPGACIAIDKALNGKVGDTCALDKNLCSPGFACEITSLAPVGGNCAAKLDTGAACHASFPDECADDQYCALDPRAPLMPGTCTDKPKAGEKCGPGLGDSLICAPYTRCDNGVCHDIAHAGEQCTVDDTCYSGHCVNKACVTGNSCQ